MGVAVSVIARHVLARQSIPSLTQSFHIWGALLTCCAPSNKIDAGVRVACPKSSYPSAAAFDVVALDIWTPNDICGLYYGIPASDDRDLILR